MGPVKERTLNLVGNVAAEKAFGLHLVHTHCDGEVSELAHETLLKGSLSCLGAGQRSPYPAGLVNNHVGVAGGVSSPAT